MTERNPLPSEPRPDELHPADLADQLQRLPVDEANAVLQELSAEQAGQTLVEMEKSQLVELLDDINPERLTDLLTQLPADDAADLLQHLTPARRREIFSTLPAVAAVRVRSLLRYAEDTAGGIMTNRMIALRVDMTIEQVRELLRVEIERSARRISLIFT